jgi:hypothetical protein
LLLPSAALAAAAAAAAGAAGGRRTVVLLGQLCHEYMLPEDVPNQMSHIRHISVEHLIV